MNNIRKPIESVLFTKYGGRFCPESKVRQLEQDYQKALNIIDKMYYDRCDSEKIFLHYRSFKTKGE